MNAIKTLLLGATILIQSCALNSPIKIGELNSQGVSKNEPRYDEAVLPKEVESYFSGIRSDIERRWSRPPNARNGQKVLIRILLMPGGELVAAKVVQSSGDTVFDQYAISAVEKVGTFVVPSDPDMFDEYFRQLTLLFMPKDLGQ